MVSKSMLDFLLLKQLTYEPQPIPYYNFQDISWTLSNEISNLESGDAMHPPLHTLCVITCYLDYSASQLDTRVAGALSYYEALVAPSHERAAGTMIHLQGLIHIIRAIWVQQHYYLTGMNTEDWEDAYSQVTPIDRCLAVEGVSRLRFVSEYQRTATFTDVRLPVPQITTDDEKGHKILRLTNVHLDSHPSALRLIQGEGLAQHFRNPELEASIAAGDVNATIARERDLPANNGLQDAYLVLGGNEGDRKVQLGLPKS